MSRRGHNAETFLQNAALAALGCEPGVVLFRNTVGRLRYYDEKTGEERHLTYGLCPGSADVIGIVDGRFAGFEMKLPGETMTPQQETWAAMVRAAGAFCVEVHSVDEMRAAVARCRKGASQ